MKALEHLHNKGVMHRDIKPENILLGKNGQVKLADFGLSIKVTSKLDRQIGTHWFMAPELIKSNKYDCKVDIWSFGIMLIEMIDGACPYSLVGGKTAMELIIRKGVPEIANKDAVDNVVKDLLRLCLKVDPKLRYTASELLDHALMKLVPENSEEKLAKLVVKVERKMNPKRCDECSVM